MAGVDGGRYYNLYLCLLLLLCSCVFARRSHRNTYQALQDRQISQKHMETDTAYYARCLFIHVLQWRKIKMMVAIDDEGKKVLIVCKAIKHIGTYAYIKYLSVHCACIVRKQKEENYCRQRFKVKFDSGCDISTSVIWFEPMFPIIMSAMG